MPEPAGHEVQLPRADQRVGAGRVAVLDLAGEQPRGGLQPGVRVAGHRHPAGQGHVVGPVVVHEAPRPDERPRPLRQAAPHRHRPRTAERHVPVGQHDRPGRSILTRSAHELGGRPVQVAHRLSLTSGVSALRPLRPR